MTTFRTTRSALVLACLSMAAPAHSSPVVVYRASPATVTPLVGENVVPTPSGEETPATPMAIAAPAASSLKVSAGQSWSISMTASGGKPTATGYVFAISPALPTSATGSTLVVSDAGNTFTVSGTAPLGSYGPYVVTAKDSKNVAVSSEPFTVVVEAGPSKISGFGWNYNGVFGNGAFNVNSHLPAPVAGNGAYSNFTASFYAGCGLQSGKAWCWGSNYRGYVGATTTGTVNGYTGTTSPVAVQGNHVFSSISSKDWTTCGLESGKAWCWGYNSYGQLGRSPGSLSDSAVPLKESTGKNFDSISTGGDFVCGLDAGKASCWGKLGTIETHVPWSVDDTKTFKSIASGYNFACGTTTSDETWCWGANAANQLGTGSSASNTPRRIDTALKFETLSLAYAHACGIAAGSVYCWGLNNSGQLGLGAALGTNSPVPVLADPARTYTAIAAGGYDHTCGLSGGKMFCWGSNGKGQGGRASTAATRTPTAESTGASFTGIVAGYDATFAFSN